VAETLYTPHPASKLAAFSLKGRRLILLKRENKLPLPLRERAGVRGIQKFTSRYLF